MPTDTIVVVVCVIAAFGLFAAMLLYADWTSQKKK